MNRSARWSRAAVVHEPPAVALLGRDSPEWRALADIHDVTLRRGPMHGFAAFGAMTMTDPPRVFRTPAGRSLVARGSQAALAAGAAARALTRRPPGTMTRQLLNAGHLLRAEMPLALDHVPPLDRLADVPVPWCVAIGRDSAGRPYDRPGRVIAERAGVACVEVAGGHTEYSDGSWRIAPRTASGWRRVRPSAQTPPMLVPKTAAGASPSAPSRAAASSACSSTEVALHPAGGGLRELPRRS